jgi:enoyl-[acyl-carrier protein] reductase III
MDVTPTRDLDGKVALITGGGRGIGKAITLRLAQRGANVVICYLRKRDAAEDTCRLAEEHAVKAVAVRANVGEEAALEGLIEEVDVTFGRLDVLVSNAATGVIRGLEGLDARAWSWTMDANARSLFLLAKRGAPLMRDGGSIVSLSSLGSQRVLPGYMVVGASKAAIETVTRYLAVELAPQGIRANVVSPGVVDTDALRHFPARDEILQKAREVTPSGSLATPEDVAGAVDFLTSPMASMITGHTLVIDGGASLVA